MTLQFTMNREMRQQRMQALKAYGNTHLIPIFATLEKGVAVLAISDNKAVTLPPTKRRALLTIIGDDYAFARGPAAFHLRSLRKILGNARAVFVMAGAPVAAHYAAAADMAEAGLNTVIIETQTTEEQSWSDFVKRHAPKRAFKLLVTPNAAMYGGRRRAA